MAIDNLDIIDGIDVDRDNNCICLLIADPLEWRPDSTERPHIKMLSQKIEAYMDYLEAEQYKNIYPNVEFDSAIIEIHFRYPITKKCKAYLERMNDTIQHNGVMLEVHIG